MDEARDDVFCHLTARRCVATAALRLGLERMSEESLDALAGVLLAYLERVGQTLAAEVEASGRSSAHVNLWDCLRAVEMNTEAAVQRVHMDGGSGGSSTGIGSDASSEKEKAVQLDPAEMMSWKGLAAFCFGPKWAEPLTLQELSGGAVGGGPLMPQQEENGGPSAGGGKFGPSAIMDENGDADGNGVGTPGGLAGKSGWYAPFPDEIPAFPVTLHHTSANPVPAQLQSTAESLHASSESSTNGKGTDQGKENSKQNPLFSLDDLTDAVFQKSSWGEIGSNNNTGASAVGSKRKRDGDGTPTQDTESGKSKDDGPPPNKKKRTDPKAALTAPATKPDEDVEMQEEEEEDETEDETHPTYVPRHFPPFPRHRDLVGPIVADDIENAGESRHHRNGAATKDVDAKKSEASATNNTTAATSASTTTTTSPKDEAFVESKLQVRSALVKLGRPWGAMSDDEDDDDDEGHEARQRRAATMKRFLVPGSSASKPNGAPKPLEAPIVPLGRASGSRPCRIMEGSMDSYAT